MAEHGANQGQWGEILNLDTDDRELGSIHMNARKTTQARKQHVDKSARNQHAQNI